MSAQVIAALRRRAAALKAEAHAALLGGQVPGPQGRPRPPELLLLLADEFRALANEAEGLEPQNAPDGKARA